MRGSMVASVQSDGPEGSGSRGVWTQFLAAFVAHLITLDNGYVVGWSAVATPLLKDNGTLTGVSPPLGRPLSAHEASWLASAALLASAAGPLACGALSRRCGYKRAGYAVGGVAALGGAGVLLAGGFWPLLAARALTGLALGAIPVVGNAYIAEAAQRHVRGALGTFFALMFNAGVLAAYLVGAAASYRAVCAVTVGLPLLYLAAFLFLPESPQYLLSKKRYEEAARSLAWFRAADHDVDAELEEMLCALEYDATGKAAERMTVARFFRDRASRRGLLALLVLIVNQELDGSVVVLNYVVETLSAARGGLPARWAAVLVAALQLAATLLSSALVDRAGRRPLLLASNAGMAVCLSAVGVYFYAQALGLDVSVYSWLPVAALSLLLVLNAFGIGSLLFVIATELFAPEAQPVAFSFGFTAVTVVTAAVVKLYVLLVHWIHIHGVYWLFAVTCILSNAYIFFFLPETKNRPIADIVSELRGERRSKMSYAEIDEKVPIKNRKTSKLRSAIDYFLVPPSDKILQC